MSNLLWVAPRFSIAKKSFAVLLPHSSGLLLWSERDTALFGTLSTGVILFRNIMPP